MGIDVTYVRVRGALAAAAIVVCVMLLAGCSAAPWRSNPDVGESRILGQRVWVTVTLDGGATTLTRRSVPIKRGDTPLSVLEDVADVRRAPDGTIAQVDGKGGGALGALGPDPESWFYRVDGVEDLGDAPDDFQLKPGQSVWWDLRRFDIYQRIPVAVGNFPEPLFSGFRDNKRPLLISYGSGFSSDAHYIRDTVFQQLNPQVQPIAGDDGFGGIGGNESRSDKNLNATVAVRRNRANFVIGRWEQLRMDPFIIDMGTDPRNYGLTTWIEGTQIRRQNPNEEQSEVLGDAEGLVWATTTDAKPDSTIVFVVTGTTDEGVRGALRALRSGGCQYYISCAVDRDGNIVR